MCVYPRGPICTRRTVSWKGDNYVCSFCLRPPERLRSIACELARSGGSDLSLRRIHVTNHRASCRRTLQSNSEGSSGNTVNQDFEAISRRNRSNRSALGVSFAWPNFQHIAVVFANQTFERAAASTSGKMRSKLCSNRCSRRQVAIAALRSASVCEPHCKTNGQIALGSCETKCPISMIACQRASSCPSGAEWPGKILFAAAIASCRVRTMASGPIVALTDHQLNVEERSFASPAEHDGGQAQDDSTHHARTKRRSPITTHQGTTHQLLITITTH